MNTATMQYATDTLGYGEEVEQRRREAAEKCFEAHDFGEEITVKDVNGWEFCTGDTVWSRVVFVEEEAEGPSDAVVFVVHFSNEREAVITDSYHYFR